MGARMVCGDAHAHVLLPFLFPAHCRAQYTAAIYLGFQAGHCPGSVSPSCSRLHLRPPVPAAQTVPADGGRTHSGLPSDGELLHLRSEHPQHFGRGVQLLTEFRPGLHLSGDFTQGNGERPAGSSVRGERADPLRAGPLSSAPRCRSNCYHPFPFPTSPQLPGRRICCSCLLYTSDAADDLTSVDLGGRRIIKKKTKNKNTNK